MASIAKRPDGRWRARYRDAAGKERAKHFDRKVDAQRWLDEVTTSMVTGQYVDPKAGRVTFRTFAEEWRKSQVHRPSTVANVETQLRLHAYPTFGETPIASIRPSQIQAWVKGLTIAPATVAVAHAAVSSIFKAAVRDRVIPSNPCEGTKLPEVHRAAVVPLRTDQVERLRAAMPERFRAMVILAAGTGMRPSEVTGLTVDRLHMLRREVVVDRQLVTLVGQAPGFGPPKTRSSYRTIPLPQVVVDVLAAHLAAYPPGEHGLVFALEPSVGELGAPITRRDLSRIWRPAADKVGIESGTGMHVLRHYYASLLIRHGESVKTVQARLGHATAAETLDTYAHLWPDSDDRTREAVDAVLGAPADSPRTEGGER